MTQRLSRFRDAASDSWANRMYNCRYFVHTRRLTYNVVPSVGLLHEYCWSMYLQPFNVLWQSLLVTLTGRFHRSRRKSFSLVSCCLVVTYTETVKVDEKKRRKSRKQIDKDKRKLRLDLRYKVQVTHVWFSSSQVAQIRVVTWRCNQEKKCMNFGYSQISFIRGNQVWFVYLPVSLYWRQTGRIFAGMASCTSLKKQISAATPTL